VPISVNSSLVTQAGYGPGRDITIRFAGWISVRISEFATGYEYRTANKRDTDKDIRNAFLDVEDSDSWKISILHNHSFSIFASIFSAFCAMTPSLSRA